LTFSLFSLANHASRELITRGVGCRREQDDGGDLGLEEKDNKKKTKERTQLTSNN
jgi:hypothetical protein